VVGEAENNKTLGIYWKPQSDTIQYNIREFSSFESVTKRLILSITSQIFDILGQDIVHLNKLQIPRQVFFISILNM